jgi:hypothetical protein
MKSKVALKVIYPHLEGLFRLKLGVANPPMQNLLVHEINLMTKAWKGRPITTAVKDQALQILFEIIDLVQMGPENTTATWLDSIRDEAIFPVASSNSTILLCTSSDHFYIPDSEKYGRRCAGNVPLLHVDRKQLYHIQPLLDLEVFKPRLLYLRKAVYHRSVASGPRILDNAFTTKYASRVLHIER